MTKQEAEDFIYKSYLKAERHQNYADKDAVKRKPQYTRDMLRELSKTPCVIVTGSKGKGSVANMIAQILQSQMCVGLMTSPHIKDFCERFKVDGKNISDSDFVRCIEYLQPEFDKIDASIPIGHCISPMGVQAAVALTYFNSRNTQFNVIECGKGARFDDVNNVIHEYAVINSIFLEHTRELGSTVEEIAHDKSHVINGQQKCVYVGEQTPEALAVIERRAKNLNVPVRRYGFEFKAQNIRYTLEGMKFDVVVGDVVYRDIVVPLLGEHQAKNCAMALALCLDVMPTINLSKIKESLLSLSWPGRMEILSSHPFTLLDACINRESARNVIQTLEYLKIKKFTAIIGIPDDKDYIGVAEALHQATPDIIMTKSQNVHYVFTENQVKTLSKMGIPAIWSDNLCDAFLRAKEKGESIVILGTTSLVSEAKDLTI